MHMTWERDGARADLDALHALHDAACAALCGEAVRRVPQPPCVAHAEVSVQHERVRRLLPMRLNQGGWGLRVR